MTSKVQDQVMNSVYQQPSVGMAELRLTFTYFAEDTKKLFPHKDSGKLCL